MLFVPKSDFEIFDEDNYNEDMLLVEADLRNYRESGFFNSFDGKKIYYEYYKAVNSTATVVLVHGYTEFSEKYHELCYYFLNSGFNVFVYDQRGHGLSCRETDNMFINHINDFEDYSRDLGYYIDKIVEPHSDGLPIYIFSHSMGGAVTALYLATCNEKIKKAVLASPMIYPVCTPLPRYILRMLLKNEARKNGWDAKFRFSSEFDPDIKFEENKSDLSRARFLYNLELRKNNPNYQNSASSNRWNFEVLGVMDTIFKKCNRKTVKAEVYIINAACDQVVKPRPQRRLAKALKCKYDSIDGARHFLCTAKKDKFSEFFDMVISFYRS